MTRAIVSGATSMIGVACIESCLQAGNEVLAIVRPGTSRLGRLPADPGLQVAACEIRALDAFQPPSKGYGVFFHCAWEATSHQERIDPVAQEKNIRYALDAVRLAKRLGCEKFVGVGSQAEYGPSDGFLRPDSPVRPVTAYGAAKYAASVLCAIECRRSGMQFNWARVFSVYGPHDNDETLVSMLIRSLRQQKAMPLTACEQMWDYLYSADCGLALRLIGQYGKEEAVYCVGSGRVLPLIEYVRAIRDAIDPALALGIGALPYAKNQAMFLGADIRSLTEDTGFLPSTSFEDGIKRTIEAFAAKETGR